MAQGSTHKATSGNAVGTQKTKGAAAVGAKPKMQAVAAASAARQGKRKKPRKAYA